MEFLPYIIGSLAGLLIGGGLAYAALNASLKGKASSIIKEAEQKGENIKEKKILQAKEKFLKLKEEHSKEIKSRNAKVQSLEDKLKNQERNLKRDENQLADRRKRLDRDEETLKAIATATDAKYFRANSAQDLEQIYATIDELEPSPAEVDEIVQHEELFQYPLLPGGLLLALQMLLSATWLRRGP